MAQIRLNDYTQEVLRSLQGAATEALNAVGFYIEGEAKKNVRKYGEQPGAHHHGFLLNSISFDTESSSWKVRIGSDKEYSVYFEKGTGIYAVDGNGRQTPWVYEIDGKFYTTKGQQPKPFLTPAIEDNIETIVRIITANIQEEMR